jgi:hypothetical protein
MSGGEEIEMGGGERGVGNSRFHGGKKSRLLRAVLLEFFQFAFCILHFAFCKIL